MFDNKNLEPQLIPALKEQVPLVQNLWLYYVYDMERYCGFNKGWESPTDLAFIPDDLTPYFIEPSKKAFIVKINSEIGGFVLLNKVGTLPNIDWRIDEFFILGKYQGKGVGRQIAHQLWRSYPGFWEFSVVPENQYALNFWRNTVALFTNNNYTEEFKTIGQEKNRRQRHFLRFNSAVSHPSDTPVDTPYTINFVDKISEETEQRMQEGFVEYETSQGISVNYQQFYLTIKNENKEVFGVLNAFTAFAEIYVDDIWVDKNYRGKGYGKKLLQALELHFKDKGFNNINLVTSAFQAPDFYIKCGYTAEFTRVNKQNPKLTKTFFIKYFPDEIQTQGLIHKK